MIKYCDKKQLVKEGWWGFHCFSLFMCLYFFVFLGFSVLLVVVGWVSICLIIFVFWVLDRVPTSGGQGDQIKTQGSSLKAGIEVENVKGSCLVFSSWTLRRSATSLVACKATFSWPASPTASNHKVPTHTPEGQSYPGNSSLDVPISKGVKLTVVQDYACSHILRFPYFGCYFQGLQHITPCWNPRTVFAVLLEALQPHQSFLPNQCHWQISQTHIRCCYIHRCFFIFWMQCLVNV